jgi:hypothetical protein
MNADETARRLRDIDRPVLAALIEREGGLPVADYAARLHEHRPARPLEPAMAAALQRELERVALPADERQTVFAHLERARVLQTTTHVALTEGPIFFASHYVGSLGLPPEAPYVVAAFSGIAFSNGSRPGCLNFARLDGAELFDPASAHGRRWSRSALDRARQTAERRLSLIPGHQRSALLFGASVEPETVERVAALRGPVREVIPTPFAGESFTAWAARGHRALHRRVLARKAVTLDVNEVLRGYLMTALDDGAHPLHRVLFDERSRGLVLGGSRPSRCSRCRSWPASAASWSRSGCAATGWPARTARSRSSPARSWRRCGGGRSARAPSSSSRRSPSSTTSPASAGSTSSNT